ncbi:MAG: TlpA family protein disulfide reductase [Acidobacteria bacterium]|nr:TlpA family protein disulfide reductase [Acidobacteriota bacterium]
MPAAIATLVLGLLTTLGAAETTKATGAFICPSDTKRANLNFTLKDLNGNDVRLAEYEGQVILLDFWATWCGPCKVEIPWFVDLQTRYGKQGLQVLGISVDDTIEKLKPYAAQFKMNYPVLQGLSRDDVLNAFGPMDGFPTTLVISREGRICETHIGLSSKSSFETQIKALLPERRR